MNLNGKVILLGVTGGIAAYKSVELVRLMIKAGARVHVVMTEGAKKFITPLTFQAISNQPVRDSLFDLTEEHAMSHIALARAVDLVVVAPATAQCIAQLAHGMANDLLTTVVLATTAPVMIVPAMNCVMWQNQAVQDNLQTLLSRQIDVCGPDVGAQACGDTGPGRMLEPEDIVNRVNVYCQDQQLLSGETVMITAGPTHEALDPVRFLANSSSGLMGYQLAVAAKRLGANVILISGPVQQAPPAGVTVISVTTALDMDRIVQAHLKQTDIFIGAAAVADYRPQELKLSKIKKNAEPLTLRLIANPDIILNVANSQKRPKLVVGFAAQTHDVVASAKKKLIEKKLDYIIANKVGFDCGFGDVSNEMYVISKDYEVKHLQKAAKPMLAFTIMGLIAKRANILL